MSWFIKKVSIDLHTVFGDLTQFVQGMVVGDDESVSLPFERILHDPIRDGNLHFKDQLWVCDRSIAPDFSWRNPSGKFPKTANR